MNKVIKSVIASVMLIISIYCYKIVSDMNIIPNKYLYLLLGIIIVLNLLGILFLFIKGIGFKVVGVIIYIVLGILSIVGIKYGSNTISYLNKGFNNNNLEVSKYNVVVLKDSSYKKLKDLDDLKIGYLKVNTDGRDYLDVIRKKVKANYSSYDINKLYTGFINKEIDSIVIEDSYLDMLEEQFKDFSSSIRIIYSYTIKKKDKKVEQNINELKPFNVYISGSDSRSNEIVANSRSDVNMIASINPNTHTVVLTSIPRDYYVQLHGTTGLKDKLTHAGIYGVDMSRETLEDLFQIKIDYSIKVSMSSVVSLVDLVGGVDIDSDKTFNSFHIKGWTVNKGINHMNGKQALAYARERYAYENGDVHRVQNQQQVLEAVLQKIISDKTILLKYESLLNSFSNLYRTDIPKDLITLLVKEQLNDMKSWNIEKQYVDGTGSMAETYSMPGVKLYVMNPSDSSLKKAINKIKDTIDE